MLLWLFIAAAWAGSCETHWIGQAGKLSPMCEELRRRPGVSRNADGTLNVNPLSFARSVPSELRRPVKEVSTDASKLQNLRNQFQAVKDSMIALVTRGLAESSWNAQQKYLVGRLREVKLSLEFGDHCANPDESANGTYSQVENVVRLCPLYSHMPAQAALGIMAHELGHLADPCNYVDRFTVSAELHRKNAIEFPRALRQSAATCLAGSPGLNEFQIFLARPTVASSQSVVLYPYQSGGQRDLTERLAQCGQLTAPAIPAPRTYEGNPFLSTLACVANNFRNGSGGSAPDRMVNATSPIASALCAGHTHTKECQADHLGMAVFHKYLREHASSTGPDALFYMRMNHCLDRGVADPKSEYPPSDERLRLLFGSPEARKLAACESDTQAKCPVPTDSPITPQPNPPPTTR